MTDGEGAGAGFRAGRGNPSEREVEDSGRKDVQVLAVVGLLAVIVAGLLSPPRLESLDWGTYWTAVGSVGTTGALVLAGLALRADSRAARRSQREAAQNAAEAAERAAADAARDRERYAASLDRQDRLHAYRDHLVAQDARITTSNAHVETWERWVKDEAQGAGITFVRPAPSATVNAEALEVGRQQAWGALAVIRLIAPESVVQAARRHNNAVHAEVTAVAKAMATASKGGAAAAARAKHSPERDMARQAFEKAAGVDLGVPRDDEPAAAPQASA